MSDLKRLGRQSWLKNMTKPKTERPKVDSGVVTRYSAVPRMDVSELRRFVELDPSNVELKDMLAFQLYSLGSLDEALELFRDLLQRKHKPAQQRLYIGNCYFQKGLAHLAVLEWEWILSQPDADPQVVEKARERIAKTRESSETL